MAIPYLYTDLNTFLAKHFAGKVQKITLNAGFSCPNRDGTVGTGGCTYCDNRTFSPVYSSSGLSLSEQLQEGIRFFARKYPQMRYLAYFQTYTNTYADLDVLRRCYEEVLAVAGVVGIIIATRPDCVDDALLDYLQALSARTFLLVEYGMESADNATLQRIRRGHTFEQTQEAIRQTAARGIRTGGHVILGLPGDTRESLLRQAEAVSALPLETLKIHQLQIVRSTAMAEAYRLRPEDFPLVFADADDYIDLVIDYIERLRPDLVLERFVSQSPPEMLVAPKWNLKNYQFVARLKQRMLRRGAWQGKQLSTHNSQTV